MIVPAMKRLVRGKVIAVSSLSVMMGVPTMGAYSAARIIDSPKPPLRRVVGLDGHLFTLFRRIVPRALFHWIVYNSQYGKGDWEKALQRERAALQGRPLGE